MSDDDRERVEGLDPKELLRTALSDNAQDAEASERVAEEERRVRAEIEERLRDLEIIELLGRGGMGYVYRARQKALDREVALKVVAPDSERQASFAERFAREAKALARLSHPNLVAVHDYGQDGPFAWLVMEYVDGSNLRELIRAGKLDPAEALSLVPKICDALQFAHDHGVVHRDVKPENILVDREGGVKIADFGLAKLIGTPAAVVSLTGTQDVLGTFRYMAPEQLDRPLEVDHRADIYSLGVVFYEMLTGEVPMGRFDPPSLHSTASRGIDEVVLRALERAPERRYQRVSEVKSDLESVERGGRRPASSTERIPAPKFSVGAVVSVILFVASFASFMLLTGLSFADEATGSDEATALAVVIGLLGFAGLVLLVAGTVTGFLALVRIRRAWPRLYGVGAAVVGAWAGIVFVINAMVLAALDGLPPAQVLAVPLLLVADVMFLRRRRRRFLEKCRGDDGSGDPAIRPG